jgi:hypothetical protein
MLRLAVYGPAITVEKPYPVNGPTSRFTALRPAPLSRNELGP